MDDINFIKNIINNLALYTNISIDMDFSYSPEKVVDKYIEQHEGEDMSHVDFDINDIKDDYFPTFTGTITSSDTNLPILNIAGVSYGDGVEFIVKFDKFEYSSIDRANTFIKDLDQEEVIKLNNFKNFVLSSPIIKDFEKRTDDWVETVINIGKEAKDEFLGESLQKIVNYYLKR